MRPASKEVEDSDTSTKRKTILSQRRLGISRACPSLVIRRTPAAFLFSLSQPTHRVPGDGALGRGAGLAGVLGLLDRGLERRLGGVGPDDDRGAAERGGDAAGRDGAGGGDGARGERGAGGEGKHGFGEEEEEGGAKKKDGRVEEGEGKL